MARGGRQPGAGRPKGATTKPRLSDYITEEQVNNLVLKAYEMAATGDSTMLKFILEQHFGKAVQPIGNDGDQPFKVQGIDIVIRK
jgi:hypothetical protein